MAFLATAALDALNAFGITDAIKSTVKIGADKLADVINDPASYRERRLLNQIHNLNVKRQNDQNFLDVKGKSLPQWRIDNINLRIKNYKTQAEALAKKIDVNKSFKKGGATPIDEKLLKRMLKQNTKKLDDRFNVTTWKYQPTLSGDDFSVWYDKMKGGVVVCLSGQGGADASATKTSKELAKFKKMLNYIAKRKRAQNLVALVDGLGGSQATDLFTCARDFKSCPMDIVVGGCCCGTKIKGLETYSKARGGVSDKDIEAAEAVIAERPSASPKFKSGNVLTYTQAVRLWNAGKETYCVPKKGSAEYDEILKIMKTGVVEKPMKIKINVPERGFTAKSDEGLTDKTADYQQQLRFWIKNGKVGPKPTY